MLSNVKRTPDVPIHLLLLLKNSLALATPANFLLPFIAHQASQRVDLPPTGTGTKHPFSPQVLVPKKKVNFAIEFVYLNARLTHLEEKVCCIVFPNIFCLLSS